MSKSLLAVIASLALVCGSAFAQANLSFSGGSGSPFSLTLTQPVVFTIATVTGDGSDVLFVVRDVGNIFSGQIGSSGTMSYTINGGAALPLRIIGNGVAIGVIRPNDFFFYSFGPSPGANVGDIIRLNTGTLTTNIAVPAAPPTNGPRAIVITDGNGVLSSAPGIAVPEPSSAASFVTGGIALALALQMVRRRRQRSA